MQVELLLIWLPASVSNAATMHCWTSIFRSEIDTAGELYMIELERNLKILEATQVVAGTAAQLEDALARICRFQQLKPEQPAWVLLIDESDSMHASLTSDRYRYEQVLEALKGRGPGIRHRKEPHQLLKAHPPLLICVTATNLPTILQLEDQGYEIRSKDLLTIRGSEDYMGVER